MTRTPRFGVDRNLRSGGIIWMALGVAVLWVAGPGCAGDRAAAERDQPPGRRAVEASRSTIHRGIDRGFRRSEDADSYRVPLRYNPPRCDGPDFEIRAHGRWKRVWLDGPTEVRGRIETYRDDLGEHPTLPETFEIVGVVSGSRRAATGVSYPIFWVTEFQPED